MRFESIPPAALRPNSGPRFRLRARLGPVKLPELLRRDLPLPDLPWKVLAAGAIIGLLVAAASALDPGRLFEFAELKALNGQFNVRGTMAPRSPIVIVTVDEDSFDELDLAWPWPRAFHGKFLDIVSRGKPAAIGLDLIFAEPSSRGPSDDLALAGAIARARNVVLGAALTTVREDRYEKKDLNAPIRPVRDGAVGFGFVNYEQDIDAFVRHAALTQPYQDGRQPAFDLVLYRLAVTAGVPARPLPRQPEIIINYRGRPRTFPWIPFHRVINGEVPPETFAGKIVLVGATTQTLHDVFPTPFAPEGTMPGVEIHANTLESLLQGTAIRRPPATIVRGLTVVAAILSAWAAARLHPLIGFGLIAGAALAFLGASHGAFLRGYWIDVVPVPLAMAVAYFGTVVRDFIQEQREKRRLSRFFSPEVVKEIVRHKDDAALDSGRRRVTVLFSDIRGFTSISERMSPEEVVAFLREYLTEMTEAVFKHGGTIDKYMGDGIMALYNVPFEAADHAARAVRTGLEFQERLKPLAERFAAQHGGSLRCGVGINTGEAVVGTIGSRQRLEYTAIGDAINLGSRLESATKDFNVPIIVGEETYAEVRDLFAMRYLGEVPIRGKELPVRIYTVLGLTGPGSDGADVPAAESPPAPDHSMRGLPATVMSTSRSPSK